MVSPDRSYKISAREEIEIANKDVRSRLRVQSNVRLDQGLATHGLPARTSLPHRVIQPMQSLAWEAHFPVCHVPVREWQSHLPRLAESLCPCSVILCPVHGKFSGLSFVLLLPGAHQPLIPLLKRLLTPGLG